MLAAQFFDAELQLRVYVAMGRCTNVLYVRTYGHVYMYIHVSVWVFGDV